MRDAASHALHARLDGPEGLNAMLLLSVAAHVLAMMVAVLAPPSFWQRQADMRSSSMMIDLGPTTGPRFQAITSIGSRGVQWPVADLPKVKATRPSTRNTPDSVLPSEIPRVSAKAISTVNDVSEENDWRTQSNAGAGRTGSTRPAGAEVGRGNGGEMDAASTRMNLSTRVGSGGQVNVGDFCCPDYLAMMLQRIRQNWQASAGNGAVTTMKFTIARDGAITNVHVVRASGSQMLDFLAERALLAVGQLPPLPDAYPNSSLVVSLDFQYQR